MKFIVIFWNIRVLRFRSDLMSVICSIRTEWGGGGREAFFLLVCMYTTRVLSLVDVLFMGNRNIVSHKILRLVGILCMGLYVTVT